jgi:putative endonuclease
MPKQGYVYILASDRNGTLYIGVTSDINARIFQHKNKTVAGFTKRYGVTHLVYCEEHDSIVDAIAREKAMKKWDRAWKLELIESINPDWRDLANEFIP